MPGQRREECFAADAASDCVARESIWRFAVPGFCVRHGHLCRCRAAHLMISLEVLLLIVLEEMRPNLLQPVEPNVV